MHIRHDSNNSYYNDNNYNPTRNSNYNNDNVECIVSRPPALSCHAVYYIMFPLMAPFRCCTPAKSSLRVPEELRPISQIPSFLIIFREHTTPGSSPCFFPTRKSPGNREQCAASASFAYQRSPPCSLASYRLVEIRSRRRTTGCTLIANNVYPGEPKVEIGTRHQDIHWVQTTNALTNRMFGSFYTFYTPPADTRR